VSLLKDQKIGIDANYWLRKILPKEPTVVAIGGFPLGLRTAIEKELENFKYVTFGAIRMPARHKLIFLLPGNTEFNPSLCSKVLIWCVRISRFLIRTTDLADVNLDGRRTRTASSTKRCQCGLAVEEFNSQI
jgi:hypothetical protein